MNSPLNDNTVGYTNYWTLIKRRKWSLLIPFILISVVGIGIAYTLPPVFKSEANIIIERQSIPKDLIDTTITSYVQEQIEQIRQRIATTENLKQIADQFDLYNDEREKDPQEAFREINSSFVVATKDVTTIDPDQRGTRRATVSFTIGFSYPDAERAQQVAADLTDRFLASHREDRTAKAQEVIRVLEFEADSLKSEVSAMEGEIAEFKQNEFSQLPELMNMNLRLFEKSELAVAQTETQIRQYNDKLDALRAEQSLTDPYRDVETEAGNRIATASKRLSGLTAEFLRLSERYSARHPDVIRLSREIRSLAEQSGDNARADEILTQLVRQQEKLRDARLSYGAQHPEVLGLEKSIAALQRGLQSVAIGSSNSLASLPPDNPRYVSLQSTISGNESNLQAARSNLTKYQKDVVEYERRLYETPVVDNNLSAQMLEYEGARQKYRDLKKKLRDAQLALRLESGGNAERFVLANPAYLPVLPESPNRIAISALAIMFAAIFGLLLAALREYLDKTIRGSKSISDILGVPPLAVIPVIPLSPQTLVSS